MKRQKNKVAPIYTDLITPGVLPGRAQIGGVEVWDMRAFGAEDVHVTECGTYLVELPFGYRPVHLVFERLREDDLVLDDANHVYSNKQEYVRLTKPAFTPYVRFITARSPLHYRDLIIRKKDWWLT